METATTPPITIDALGPSFVRHLRAENKSPKTITAYLLATEGFHRFLAERGMPQGVSSIRREHVESYVEECLTRHAPATANQRYRSLQQFFRWAVEEGELPANPMA